MGLGCRVGDHPSNINVFKTIKVYEDKVGDLYNLTHYEIDNEIYDITIKDGHAISENLYKKLFEINQPVLVKTFHNNILAYTSIGEIMKSVDVCDVLTGLIQYSVWKE